MVAKEEKKKEMMVIDRVKRYRVCKGKSITTKKGMVHGGAPIIPSDLSNKGEDATDALLALIERGYVEEYR